MALKDLVPWHKKEGGEALTPRGGDIEDMFREAFEDFFRSWLAPTARGGERKGLRFSPDVDVTETDEDYRVSLELPGLTKDEIDISLEEGALSISGEKKEEEREEKENFVRVERSYGSFSRRIPLPAGVDEGGVEASYKDGILRVRLPKSAETRGRRIEIRGE